MTAPGSGAVARALAVAFPAATRDAPPAGALGGLSLRVAGGEIVVLIGPNGCGKSTFLRAAAGLLRPQRGEITLGGDAIAGPDPRIGLVFQEPRLLPWRSVAANVAWPLELAGWRPDRAAARVGELLGLVDLGGATDPR